MNIQLIQELISQIEEEEIEYAQILLLCQELLKTTRRRKKKIFKMGHLKILRKPKIIFQRISKIYTGVEILELPIFLYSGLSNTQFADLWDEMNKAGAFKKLLVTNPPSNIQLLVTLYFLREYPKIPPQKKWAKIKPGITFKNAFDLLWKSPSVM